MHTKDFSHFFYIAKALEFAFNCSFRPIYFSKQLNMKHTKIHIPYNYICIFNDFHAMKMKRNKFHLTQCAVIIIIIVEFKPQLLLMYLYLKVEKNKMLNN